MASGPAQLLESIPKLVAAKDAAALVALQDHDDKQVRKAARKAVHTLRSKGVTIPEAAAAKTWSAGGMEELRGDLAEIANVDVDSSPGLTRVLISAPQDERNYLWVAVITGRDQIADFAAYVQTDGQRSRLLRDWGAAGEDRRVPTSWARARIRWAREQTLSSGFSVPPQLDDMLVHLGPAPSQRPANFLVGLIEPSDYVGRAEDVGELLIAAQVHAWPPVIDVEPIVRRAGETNPGMTDQDPEDKRMAALIEAARGDEALRADLRNQVANLLDDAAIGLWLRRADAAVSKLVALANELRTSAEPEGLPWVPRLLGFQIAATVAYLSRQQQRRPQ
jgi:hypothetical protein